MVRNNERRPRGGRNRSRNRAVSSDPAPTPTIETPPELRQLMESSLDDVEFIVFDIETTGGNPERNGITEICAIKYRRGEVGERFYSLVNPQIPIPPIVRRMTGISNKTVENAPLIDEVMPKFVEFAANGVLVSHNAIGDLKFTRFYSKKVLGREMPNFFLCTHLLCDKLHPEAPDKSLNGLGKFFEIACGNLHRADADAELTLGVFQRLLDGTKERGIASVADAMRFQGDYESAVRLGWSVGGDSISRLPDVPGVFYLKDRKGKDTFVSSATSIRRDVSKLSNLSQIPRGMLRQVVLSSKVDFREAGSHLEALLLESDELSSKKFAYDPSNWHQRTILTMNIIAEGEGKIRATVSPVPENVLAAFGPVRDRRTAGIFLQDLAQRLGVECSRKGFVVGSEYLELLSHAISRNVNNWLSDIQRSVPWWKRLLGRKSKVPAEIIAAGRSLLDLATPGRFQPVHQMRGLIVVFDQAGDRVYALGGGRISREPRILKNKWKDPLPLDEVGDLLEQVRAAEIAVDKLAPLELIDALRLHAVLWWIFSGVNRREGVFYSLDNPAPTKGRGDPRDVARS